MGAWHHLPISKIQPTPAPWVVAAAAQRSTSLDKADVGEAWPLIRYLLDDPTY